MAPLGLGVIGLGRAFMLMRATFAGDPRVRLVAAADPRPEARDAFAREFGGTAYADADAVVRDSRVELVYVASPHGAHVDHVACAARAGKHVLVEKPMALSLADAQAMIEAARRAGVHLLVGHSHSFDAPYRAARRLIASGRFGNLRMITALKFTDFLYRPRRAEELDTSQGGGVVFSQAAHQVDVARLLAGGDATSIRAATGRWDPARPTEGAYQALMRFSSGATASLIYSGYGHFDTDEWMDWVGELGHARDPATYGTARRRLHGTTAQTEQQLKDARAYGTASPGDEPVGHHNHFGIFIASCERADIRPVANGLWIYGDDERSFQPLAAPAVPRAEIVDELIGVVRDGKPPLHSGEWGLATLEVCLAMLDSASSDEVRLRHQCLMPAGE